MCQNRDLGLDPGLNSPEQSKDHSFVEQVAKNNS